VCPNSRSGVRIVKRTKVATTATATHVAVGRTGFLLPRVHATPWESLGGPRALRSQSVL
jgi:hypothetical protein